MPRRSLVKKRYDDIFDKDPLLLYEGNQVKYGKEMLQHLLVSRSLTTIFPHPLDLLDNDTRESYRRPKDRPRPPKPSDEACEDYLNQRKTRGTVSKTNFDILKHVTMVADGANTLRRNKIDDRNHAKALRDFAKWGLTKAFEDRLRIAAVGYRVKISRIEDYGYFEEELCALPKISDAPVPRVREPIIETEDSQLGRTKPLSTDRVKKWEKAILTHIAKALDRKSKVVLLPEFALPSARKRGAAGPVTKDIRALSGRDETGDHFLFAGTRHEERYNRGLILSKKMGQLSDDWWHYKTASAKGLGENIIGPFGKNFPSYKSGIRIARDEAFITVAVCYDTYDPTTFLSIVLEAMDSQFKSNPKIILVPSFNPNEDFVALLRDISFLGRCTVIYVNALHGDAKMFVCGFALSDLANKFDLVMKTIADQLGQLDTIVKAEEGAVKKDKENKGWYIPRPNPVPPSLAKRRHDALAGLERTLQVAKDDHTLDHIITIEECPRCRRRSHRKDDLYCSRDVLYYNLHADLLIALAGFRKEFFGDEAFLAEPFQNRKLREAFEERAAYAAETEDSPAVGSAA